MGAVTRTHLALLTSLDEADSPESQKPSWKYKLGLPAWEEFSGRPRYYSGHLIETAWRMPISERLGDDRHGEEGFHRSVSSRDPNGPVGHPADDLNFATFATSIGGHAKYVRFYWKEFERSMLSQLTREEPHTWPGSSTVRV
jgi:hypothetical protein